MERSIVFSGIVRYRGTVATLRPAQGGMRLDIRCDGSSIEQPEPGDSVAIDGVCLTVACASDERLAFDVVPETLSRTTLGTRTPGDDVNVEFALRVGDRIGGHLVYGHVDTVVRAIALNDEGQGRRMRLERPAALAYALVDKAFTALDGVSLTIAGVGEGWFEVAIIPETLARTTLGSRDAGQRVNLEIDPLARYAHAR